MSILPHWWTTLRFCCKVLQSWRAYYDLSDDSAYAVIPKQSAWDSVFPRALGRGQTLRANFWESNFYIHPRWRIFWRLWWPQRRWGGYWDAKSSPSRCGQWESNWQICFPSSKRQSQCRRPQLVLTRPPLFAKLTLFMIFFEALRIQWKEKLALHVDGHRNAHVACYQIVGRPPLGPDENSLKVCSNFGCLVWQIWIASSYCFRNPPFASFPPRHWDFFPYQCFPVRT